MSKHFCFCIPVRAAVFFFSLITFLGSAFSAGVAWYILYLIDNNKLDTLEKNVQEKDRQAFDELTHQHKWAFIVFGAIFTIVALMSFFGFVGSVIRNRRMVKAYSFMTILIFILDTVALGFTMYALFSTKPLCVTVDNEKTCITSNLSTGQKIGFTVWTVFWWLVNLYIVAVIRRYVTQLEEEREYRHDFRLNPTAGGHYEAKEGLLPENHSYPYADNQHAFGANRA